MSFCCIDIWKDYIIPRYYEQKVQLHQIRMPTYCINPPIYAILLSLQEVLATTGIYDRNSSVFSAVGYSVIDERFLVHLSKNTEGESSNSNEDS